MVKKVYLFIALCSVISSGCYAQKSDRPADKKANSETKALYINLKKLAAKHTLFGHQDALAYGVGWRNEEGRSDVKSVSGAYPAVYGWDMGHIELDSLKELDGVPFDQLRQFVKEAYSRGGINTFSWHTTNPIDHKSAWDTTQLIVKQIIPGGAKHELYKAYLDKVAAFLGSLKTDDGKAIPVIFRPFHEHTGTWFWWCENVSTVDEFKSMWHFTFDYLTKTKGLHNLLFSYSAADFATKEKYEERYPGDDYVDMLGFDIYCFEDLKGYQTKLDRQLSILQEVAIAHNKIPALTETGYERVPNSTWWTETLMPVLAKYNMAYVLVWRNDRPAHHYAPYPGQQSADDFKKFYADPKIIFQDKLTPLSIYKSK
ncbi:glycoside hydrolase family 26 protein [Solitalea longa]|uniref:glycoside hydrolase family 26 protein n=1 Tax=Solitalea longa TaxID=2079460 RepID=UPI001A9C4B14|nr:glycosyl hydrolase [Solitalea longa]